MKQLLNRLRVQWFVVTKMLQYSSDFLDRIFKIYLNHSKVIHFRRGYPVYSLSTPALYSKPQANFFSRQLYKTLSSKNIPNLMSFAVTDQCNADCEHCSFFDGVAKEKREVLTLAQAKKLIHDAQELGVSVINFTGGEPLMRQDLPEIIRSVDKDLSSTILFTNGWFLAERVRELNEAGLDGVYVSIDSSNPQKHDNLRRKPGLFDRAVKGIKAAKSMGLSVGISCCITPESFQDGELTRIIEWAKGAGIHEVLVYDAVPTGKMRQRKDLVGSGHWIDDMIASVKPYNEDARYPGVLIYAYTTSHRGLGCSCGVNYIYVTPYGDVCPCDFNHMIFGNILNAPLFLIWDKITSLNDFRSSKWGDCKLKDPAWQNKDTVSNVFRVYEG